MTRYKGMVSALVERAVAMLPDAPRELSDSEQELNSHFNELTQDQREYRYARQLGAGNEELTLGGAEIRETLDNLHDSRGILIWTDAKSSEISANAAGAKH